MFRFCREERAWSVAPEQAGSATKLRWPGMKKPPPNGQSTRNRLAQGGDEQSGSPMIANTLRSTAEDAHAAHSVSTWRRDRRRDKRRHAEARTYVDLAQRLERLCAEASDAAFAPRRIWLGLATEPVMIELGRAQLVEAAVAELIYQAARLAPKAGNGAVAVRLSRSDTTLVCEFRHRGRGWWRCQPQLEALAIRLDGWIGWAMGPCGERARFVAPIWAGAELGSQAPLRRED
jgi:hypothetical protein